MSVADGAKRIRLSTLFVAMLVTATTMSLLGVFGFPCSVCMVLFVLAVARNSRTLAKIVVVLFVATLVPFVLCKGLSNMRLNSCSNNLKWIALALQSYRETNGCFPPTQLTDQGGKPVHSWRVLILPYLGSANYNFYRQYRCDEPWDGPNNRLLAARRPWFFACPCQPDPAGQGHTLTNYLAVIGPGTPWSQSAENGDKGQAPLGDRLLVVEVADSQINWMEPRDLTLEQLTGDNGKSPPAVSSYHSARGINVALADGLTYVLPATISGKTLHKLCTEGQHATAIEIPESQPDDLKWKLAAWLVSIVVLLVHAVKDTRAVSHQPSA